MTNPFQSRLTRRTMLGAALGLSAAAVAGCSPAQQDSAPSGGGSGESVTLSVRTWDEQLEAAYKDSFAEFSKKNPGVSVKTTLVPYDEYFTKLRTDVTGGNADDIFLMNGSYIQPYIESGNLIEIDDQFSAEKGEWIQPAVEQYSRDGKLWGVPQLTDGGIAMYYNADLLDKAGIKPEDLADLTWAPGGGAGDTFLPIAKKLTIDSAGKTADQDGFDGKKPKQWGYSAAQDLQGIYYNFLGSAGGQFQTEDGTFVFDSPEGQQAFGYIIDLINKWRVSPAASNTNDNGDFTRDQFLQGKIALFQSGIYNLKNVNDGAKFKWGIAPMPAGPKGRISVVNNVVVAGNKDSKNADATIKLLKWMGSVEGGNFIGKAGAALPAIKGAQKSFADFWAAKDVDPAQFAEQGRGESIAAPSGANYGAAFTAWKPIFDEMFLGRTPVDKGLTKAQEAANKGMKG